MKTQRSMAALVGLLIVIASFAAAVPAGAAVTNEIVVKGQDLDRGQVMIDSITAAQDGWVVIYKEASLAPASIVGYAPVSKGINTHVTVDVGLERIKDARALWARLHVDHDAEDIFEWGKDEANLADDPVEQNGQYVVAAFATTSAGGAPSAAPRVYVSSGLGASQIKIRGQDTNRGQIVVDSVTAAEDGWLVIYKQADCCPASIIGYAPVRKGQNADLTVDINRERVQDSLTLWARLHVDLGTPGVFEWEGNSEEGLFNDTPTSTMVGFGTTAD